MRRAVVYFSLTDNTREAAEAIGKELNADVYRIALKKALPDSKERRMMIGGMQSVFGMKPNILGIPSSLEQYDDIILGTPVWASKAASPINTLIADRRLADKIIAVFTFSGGGDNDKCISSLKKKLKNLKISVALADRCSELSSGNEEKIQHFIRQLQ